MFSCLQLFYLFLGKENVVSLDLSVSLQKIKFAVQFRDIRGIRLVLPGDIHFIIIDE